MELNTRSGNTVISNKVWQSIVFFALFDRRKLTAYKNLTFPVKGSACVLVFSQRKKKIQDVFAVQSDTAYLFECTWINASTILHTLYNYASIYSVFRPVYQVESFCKKFNDLFTP